MSVRDMIQSSGDDMERWEGCESEWPAGRSSSQALSTSYNHHDVLLGVLRTSSRMALVSLELIFTIVRHVVIRSMLSPTNLPHVCARHNYSAPIAGKVLTSLVDLLLVLDPCVPSCSSRLAFGHILLASSSVLVVLVWRAPRRP